jgi:thiol-disulfide isomerase/thioredoxin
VASTKYAGTVNAPELPSDLEWLNTQKPLALSDFRGKVLILDFWTYCCINCMHIIPHLRRLEARFPEELAVVGVHSAKFDQERSTENIRQAILRYGVSHPVINDYDMRVWQSFGVRAWPTLIYIDPQGKVVGKSSGELTFDEGEPLIAEMVREYEVAGLLDRAPLSFALEKTPDALLSFPGKILADGVGQRLFIADSGHHRILVTDLEGKVTTFIGSGDEGLADGTLDGAQFNRPQGMALDGEVLYVADTENHAIRRVDLAQGIVETIAGTGRQGKGPSAGGEAAEIDLRSPWDLVLIENELHIAMAGTHQLWTLDLTTFNMWPSVGSGAENITDGPSRTAALAQPSGLAEEGGVLYFADSETSAVRSADLSKDRVTTLVGRGLFDFGDSDGPGADAHLQHPLGVDVREGTIYVADTYNSKIKRIDLGTGNVTTVTGTGEQGLVDGTSLQAQLYEPGGLSVLGGWLYVADTNNHAVRAVELLTGAVMTVDVGI